MEWKEMLPYLSKQIEAKNVWRYDASGATRELTKKQANKIKELESEFKGTRVVAVLDAKYEFPDCEIHFNTYLLLSDDSTPIIANDGTREYVMFFAFVDNMDDTLCSELGDVGIVEICGLLRRVY
ncbi:hypothetical protein [Clostridium drakei]|uniref:Uncharacterized protein n=1 Tax=Clostridium drakei TaxID=332101 RepID=A0A2U8DW87_9CLOT|nr:hypothetical protein [Clostridium drakei]AWI06721.1 hypothetical protein B9W14_20220 [Clostridium drakei]